MIKEEELRIGNNLYESTGEVGTVIAGNRRLELSTEMRGNVSLAECAPIPLTPERLERLGINVCDKVIVNYEEEIQYSYRNHQLELTFTVAYVKDLTGANITRIRIRLDGEILFVPKAIIYVHQLQNLYFALTGEELTINNEAVTIN